MLALKSEKSRFWKLTNHNFMSSLSAVELHITSFCVYNIYKMQRMALWDCLQKVVPSCHEHHFFVPLWNI